MPSAKPTRRPLPFSTSLPSPASLTIAPTASHATVSLQDIEQFPGFLLVATTPVASPSTGATILREALLRGRGQAQGHDAPEHGLLRGCQALLLALLQQCLLGQARLRQARLQARRRARLQARHQGRERPRGRLEAAEGLGPRASSSAPGASCCTSTLRCGSGQPPARGHCRRRRPRIAARCHRCRGERLGHTCPWLHGS
mmetsp:Transcript_73974/g.178946  ORF Transcript_73974/g.178946 Transcript_73974/m.178946 type:complete len:200 (+) Transcript_73974:35-634(+)